MTTQFPTQSLNQYGRTQWIFRVQKVGTARDSRFCCPYCAYCCQKTSQVRNHLAQQHLGIEVITLPNEERTAPMVSYSHGDPGRQIRPRPSFSQQRSPPQRRPDLASKQEQLRRDKQRKAAEEKRKFIDTHFQAIPQGHNVPTSTPKSSTVDASTSTMTTVPTSTTIIPPIVQEDAAITSAGPVAQAALTVSPPAVVPTAREAAKTEETRLQQPMTAPIQQTTTTSSEKQAEEDMEIEALLYSEDDAGDQVSFQNDVVFDEDLLPAANIADTVQEEAFIDVVDNITHPEQLTIRTQAEGLHHGISQVQIPVTSTLYRSKSDL